MLMNNAMMVILLVMMVVMLLALKNIAAMESLKEFKLVTMVIMIMETAVVLFVQFKQPLIDAAMEISLAKNNVMTEIP